MHLICIEALAGHHHVFFRVDGFSNKSGPVLGRQGSLFNGADHESMWRNVFAPSFDKDALF